MTTIQGTVQKGFGGASGNLATQLPRIAQEFPEVAGCFHGTLNLELDQPLLVLSPDHRTRPIDWHPHHAPGEVFDLLRVRFEAPTGSSAVPAWLYIPHNSDHRKNLRIHEVIAAKVPLAEGGRCTLHLDRACIVLPYRQFAIAVIW